MGTTIEAVAASVARGGPLSKSSLRLIDDAAKDCLARAGRDADDLDLLLNAGIYHDRNLGEPALAALVQEDVGANLGHPPVGGHGTFSFDVLNGVAGVLTAAYLVDGFMRSGAAHSAMVVAGDADPDPSRSRTFGFNRSGGAMLLGWHPGDGGFTRFHLETFPEFEDLLHSELSWHPSEGHGVGAAAHRGNRLEVTQRPALLDSSLDCAVKALAHFDGGVEDTDLLIASHPSPEFGDRLADRLRLSRDIVVHLPRRLERAYTAQPIAALEVAVRDGRLAAARKTLFVAVGAGITVALAEYRRPEAAAA